MCTTTPKNMDISPTPPTILQGKGGLKSVIFGLIAKQCLSLSRYCMETEHNMFTIFTVPLRSIHTCFPIDVCPSVRPSARLSNACIVTKRKHLAKKVQLSLIRSRLSRIWAFDWYQNRSPWMTLNGVMTVILHFFAEFGSFTGRLRQSGRRQTYTVCDWNVIQRI